MAKALKLEYAALNITMHPHSVEKYIKLLYKIKKMNVGIRLRGDKFCSMSFLHERTKGQSKKEPLIGELVTYTQIDINGEWYNTEASSVATDDDVIGINIPEHLKPNCARFSFIFFPDTHLLVFESYYDKKTFPPSFAERYFLKIFEHPGIISEFDNLSVTIIKEPDEIERMLKEKGIRSVTMVTNRPNPDSLVSTERKVKERFKKINVIKEERFLKAEKGKEINFDEELKMEARVAAKNGVLKIKKLNSDGKVEEKSTEEIPMVVTAYYEEQVSSPIDILINSAYSIRKSLMKWMK